MAGYFNDITNFLNEKNKIHKTNEALNTDNKEFRFLYVKTNLNEYDNTLDYFFNDDTDNNYKEPEPFDVSSVTHSSEVMRIPDEMNMVDVQTILSYVFKQYSHLIPDRYNETQWNAFMKTLAKLLTDEFGFHTINKKYLYDLQIDSFPLEITDPDNKNDYTTFPDVTDFMFFDDIKNTTNSSLHPLYDRYFRWYKKDVTLEDVQNIYTKYHLPFPCQKTNEENEIK